MTREWPMMRRMPLRYEPRPPDPSPSPLVRIIRSTDVAACPKHSLSASHYNDDGTCRCNEEEGTS